MQQDHSRLPTYLLSAKPEQVNGEKEIIHNLNDHLKSWSGVTGKFNELQPFIEIAIAENRQLIREAYTSKNLPTKVQVDLGIIQKILSQSQQNNFNGHGLNSFLHHAKNLLSDHEVQARGLHSLSLNKDFSKITHNVVDGIDGVIGSVSNLQTSINVENMESTISQIQKVITVFKDIRLESNMAGALASNLLQKAIMNVNHEDVETATKKLKKLLEGVGNPNSDEIFKAKVALNTALVKEHNSQKDLDQTFKDINKGIGLAAELISLTGNPKLANQLMVVGNAVVDITKTLIGWTAIAAASGPAAPFLIIGGAVVALLKGLFNSGPSQEEQLLNHISKQIIQLADHVDKRFDRIEQALATMDKHILEGFSQVHIQLNNMSNFMSNFYICSMKQFGEIKGDIKKLNFAIIEAGQKIDHVSGQITDLRNYFNVVLIENYNQTYNDMTTRAKNLRQIHKHASSSEPLITETEELLVKFVSWGGTAAKTQTLSGAYQIPINAELLCEETTKKGIELHINTLVAYLNKHHEMNLKPVVNPLVWQDAAQNYMDLIYRIPQLPIDNDHIQNINEMAASGKHLKDTILNIKTSEKLFHNLCDNYRKNVKELINQIFNQNITANDEKAIIYSNKAIQFANDTIFCFTNKFWSSVFDDPTVNRKINELIKQLGILIKIPLFDRKPKQTLEIVSLLSEFKNSLSVNNYNFISDVNRTNWSELENSIAAGLVTIPSQYMSPYRVNPHSPSPETAKLLDYDIITLQFLVINSYCLSRNHKKIQTEIINDKKSDIKLMKEFFCVIDKNKFNMKITNDMEHKPLKDKVKNLEISYKLLTIFISLAFPAEYNNDKILRDYLQNKLWDTTTFKNYVKNEKTETNFILFVLEENVLNYIDELEGFLMNKVLEARIKQSLDYPLLNDTLAALDIFKSTCEGYQLIQNKPKEFSGFSDFKEKLSQLNRKCQFDIIRTSEKEIIINLKNLNDIPNKPKLNVLLDEVWEALDEVYKKFIGSNPNTSRENDTYQLKISCQNETESNKVAELLTQLVKEYSVTKPKTAVSRNLFFNSDSANTFKTQTTGKTATESENSINCVLQ